MSRILQVANFVAPHSGGIRTVLEQLAAGYALAGHEVIQIVPGPRAEVRPTSWGRRVAVPGIVLPGTGYRVLRPRTVIRLAVEIAPDRLEVHDRSTLRGLGRWAAQSGIPSAVVSHERLDRLLQQWLPGAVGTVRMADRSNAALAAAFDTVICTTGWAAQEFTRLGVHNLRQVPLGVDPTRFAPGAADPGLRAEVAPNGGALLVLASRLSREKAPELAVQVVAELRRRGQPVHLAIAGDGPRRGRLEALARDLPVTFLGHLNGADRVARLLATADVVLAPGPVETFCLSALEALASGTPVVANAASAVPEMLADGAGLAADGTAPAFATAVQSLLARPPERRRAAARARAENYDWTNTVAGFLAAQSMAAPGVV